MCVLFSSFIPNLLRFIDFIWSMVKILVFVLACHGNLNTWFEHLTSLFMPNFFLLLLQTNNTSVFQDVLSMEKHIWTDQVKWWWEGSRLRSRYSTVCSERKWYFGVLYLSFCVWYYQMAGSVVEKICRLPGSPERIANMTLNHVYCTICFCWKLLFEVINQKKFYNLVFVATCLFDSNSTK